MLLLPHMNKQLVSVPKADMDVLLQNTEVLMGQLTDKTQAALKAVGKHCKLLTICKCHKIMKKNKGP